MRLFKVLFLLISITALAFLSPHSVNASPVRLGGLDLDRFCRSLGQNGVTLTSNTWSCQSGTSVDMTAACQWQYLNPDATAAQDTLNDPYTWACYREDPQLTPVPTPTLTPTPQATITVTPTSAIIPTPTSIPPQARLGGMDLVRYCNSLSQGAANVNNNIWSCTSGTVINMTAACQWQYPNQNAIAAQDTPNNPYTWSCYQEGFQVTPTPTMSFTPTPTARITATPTSIPPQTRLGGMNLVGYCNSFGQGGAVLNNTTWVCSTGGAVINMTAACQWQYVPSAVVLQEVAGNPYTWSCYSSGSVVPTPTPTATPAILTPTPTIIPPTTTPVPTSLRVRRSIYSLSSNEVTRLVNAINILRANGVYADFMNRHLQAMMTETPMNDPTTDRNVAHRGPSFLPWHRAFIYEFEDQLRAIDPTITLPYWPFENETTGIPRVFSPGYFGSDGNRSQGDRVTDGPFASWNVIRRIGRDPDTQQTALPSLANVNTVLQYTNYDTAPYIEQSIGFVMGMEGWIGINSPWGMHNRVHGYIGGDMGTMEAANDPIFFLVHANIDRIWWNWQQMRGIRLYQPVSGGPLGHNLNDTMRFLLRTPSPANVLDIQNDMGYTYN